MSYEEAFQALTARDYRRAVDLLEPVVRETGYASDIANHALTLALYHAGDQRRLADVAFEVGFRLLGHDPASAMDYFQRALFANLDSNRSRQIGEVFEEWAAVHDDDRTRRVPSGPVRRVAHVVGCLLPGQALSLYVKSLCRSLEAVGVESVVFTTEWDSSWFFNPEGVARSRALEIDAEVSIASVEGDFLERAERVAESISNSGCEVALFHASLMEQITARVASLRPAPVQINVNHGAEMAADLFDGAIHVFQNALERTRFPDRSNQWIPLVSDIESRLECFGTSRAPRKAFGDSKTISATFGTFPKIADGEFLEALTEILQRSPSHLHLFAGPGDLRAVRSHLHAKQVLSQVRFLGDQADVAYFLPLVDFYIASFPQSSAHSVLDAMGASKPVIVLGYPSDSDSNSAAELVEIEELVASTRREFVDIAIQVIRDEDYRDALGQAVRMRFRREFRPDVLGTRYLDFLNSLEEFGTDT